jgi:hypothetical protein
MWALPMFRDTMAVWPPTRALLQPLHSSCCVGLELRHDPSQGNVNDVQGDQFVAGNCVGQMQSHQHLSPARSTTSRNLGDRQFDGLNMAKAGLCMTPITGHTPVQRHRSIHGSAQQSCGTVDRSNLSRAVQSVEGYAVHTARPRD